MKTPHMAPRTGWVRCLCAFLMLLLATPICAALLPEFALSEGEIRFDGTILSAEPGQKSFTLSVMSFTNPNGRSGKVEPAKARPMLVTDATILQVRGNAKHKLTLDDLADPLAVIHAVVIGRDGGAGQPFIARHVAVWTHAETGRYGWKAKPEAPAPPLITPPTPATPPAPAPQGLPPVVNGALHSGPVWAIAYSPDGKLIATAGSVVSPRQNGDFLEAANNPLFVKPPGQAGGEVTGSEVKLWDATTGALRASWTLQAPSPSFNATRLILSALNPAIEAPEEVTAAKRGLTDEQWKALAMSAAGSQGFGAKGIEGILWPLAFSPDGKLLAAGGLDGTARVWDTQSGAAVAALSEHGGRISGIAFTPDGKQIITSKGSPFTPLDVLKHGRASIARTPLHGEIRFWNAQSGELQRTIQTGAYTTVVSLGVSPDGSQMAAYVGTHPFLFAAAPQPFAMPAPETLGLRIYDLPTGRLLRTIQEGRSIHRIQFAPDGATIAVAALSAVASEPTKKEDVVLYDVKTGTLKKTLTGIGNARAVAFSPDGKTIAACRGDGENWNGSWMLWDATTGADIGEVKLPYPVFNIAFAPDGKAIATAGGPLPGTVKQWNPQSGEALAWKATP
jgi:WD40 repeat protein